MNEITTMPKAKGDEKKDGIVSWVLHLQNQFGHRKRGVCFSSFVWKKTSAGCWLVSFWEGPLEIHHIFFPELWDVFLVATKSQPKKWGNKCRWFLHVWINLDKEMTPSRNSMIFFQILVASRGGIAIRCISWKKMVNLWDVAILKCHKIFGNPTKNTPWTFDPNNSPHSLDFAMFYRGKIRLGVFEWLLQKAWVAPHGLGELPNELHSQNDQPYLKPAIIDFRRVLSFGWYQSDILGNDHISQPWEKEHHSSKKSALPPTTHNTLTSTHHH